MTRVPYNKLVALGDLKKTALAEYQQKNRRMELDANLGTFLKASHPEWQIDATKFDDKENSLRHWGQMNQEPKAE